MSWPLASFALLALALGAGFAWYERSHPSAKVLSLVASLAALAALGRLAFAPLPNVKPTTDIVLLAGFALGGPAGFAVGALAALSSNFVLGQGPWTPWQMAAWGAVGLAGAGLGRLTRQRLDRWTLAAVCALAGAGFGVVMNFSTWVTFTGRHTLSEYGAISASALPFDVAHVVGNVVFALLFGPALLRTLQRFRRRFEVTWDPSPSAIAAVALAAVVAVSAFAAPTARAASPAAYLEHAQNPDGGFGPSPGAASSQLYTGWAALGLAAAGRRPAQVTRDGRSPLDFIDSGLSDLRDTGSIERTIMVLGASGVSPRDFGGRDLLADLLRRRRRDGSFGGQVNLTAFGVFALRAAGRSVGSPNVRAAGSWLARQQNRDGGFSFSRRGGASGIDDTGAAVQALAAAGRRGSVTRRAGVFLRARQNRDGGFPLVPGGESNAQSTAWAIQGLLAAGSDPARLHRHGARSPLAYLHALTRADGSVRYSSSSAQTPVWVTAQAAMALARQPFPLPRRSAAPAPVPPAASPASTFGSGGSVPTLAGAAPALGTAAGGAKHPLAHAAPAAAGRPQTPLWWLYNAHDLGTAAAWAMSPVG